MSFKLPEDWHKMDADKLQSLIDEQVSNAVKQSIENEVAGLKANRDAVLEEKKALKAKLESIEAERKAAENEALEKKGDHQELWKRKEADFQAMIEDLKAKQEEANKRAEQAQKALNSRTVEDTIRAELEKVGTVQRGAWDDIKRRAIDTFAVGEGGRIEARDADGNLLPDVTPEKWAKGLRESAGYFFAPDGASGSGAKPGNGNGAPPKAWAEMTLKERTELHQQNPEQAKRLQDGA